MSIVREACKRKLDVSTDRHPARRRAERSVKLPPTPRSGDTEFGGPWRLVAASDQIERVGPGGFQILHGSVGINESPIVRPSETGC
jgi:hypothetical protein